MWCRFLLRSLVLFYRSALSPIFGGQCRFEPTCSAYALKALDEHDPLSACLLIARRLSRCHPWGDWGYDPVPGRKALMKGHTSNE